MSFVGQEDIKELVEGLIQHAWPEDLTPIQLPVPRMSYGQAIAQYGSDKPDTRFDMKVIMVKVIMVKVIMVKVILVKVIVVKVTMVKVIMMKVAIMKEIMIILWETNGYLSYKVGSFVEYEVILVLADLWYNSKVKKWSSTWLDCHKVPLYILFNSWNHFLKSLKINAWCFLLII